MRISALALVFVLTGSLSAQGAGISVVLRNNAGANLDVCVEQPRGHVCLAPGESKTVLISSTQWIEIGIVSHRYTLPATLPSTPKDAMLLFQLDSDRRIYVMFTDSKGNVAHMYVQPDGFPLVPVEVVDLT